MSAQVTASMLYDLVSCPHRVALDLFGDPKLRDAVSPFVQLLWDRGNIFEKEVIAGLEQPFLDLSGFAGALKETQTYDAMARREKLIYRGRISEYELLGDPDLLRWEGNGYVAIDIKSGSGEEGQEDDAKPKIPYAVQLALYTDILERKGLSAGRRGYIWDVHGEEVLYDFSSPQSPKTPTTLWEKYLDLLETAQGIIAQSETTLPAYSSGTCKNCHWYTLCTQQLRQANDLTLIPFLGRTKRDKLITHCRTVKDLAEADLEKFIQGKKTIFPGIRSDMLATLQRRAQLLSDPAKPGPYLKEPLHFPAVEIEVFFDIEVDPMRDVCYLHGFVERRGQDNASERYLAFYADDPTPAAEKKAFQDAWTYFQSVPSAVVYYYSKYERTIWRKLQKKYPSVATVEEIEALFAHQKSIDLYFDVVLNKTEWPTHDFSIKTLAKYLGFAWRDTHPSGAASIEWYHRWVGSKDTAVKQRILDYNEDDCRATRVLLDGLKQLEVINK